MIVPTPTPSKDSGVATTALDLEDAPQGYIAVDKNLLVYTKPFHSANMWRLGGFTELLPAAAICLPARLYSITPRYPRRTHHEPGSR